MSLKFRPGCCCVQCNIASDEFDSGSSLDTAKWDISSGTWSVGGGSASTSSTPALAIHKTEAPTLADGVTVSAQVVPDSGVKPQLIVDYVDDDNYHFAEYTGAVVSIYKRTAGSNTLIVSGSMVPLGSNWFPRLCLNGTTITARLESSIYSVGSTTTPHGGTRSGIGRDSTAGAAAFGTFSYDKMRTESNPDCPTCAECTPCDDATPSIMKVVIAGFTNPSCTGYNGTYFIPFAISTDAFGSTSCQWCLKISSSLWIGVYFNDVGSLAYAGFSASACSTGFNPQWTKSVTYPLTCFDLSDTQFPTHSGSSPCGGPPFTGDSGTCHVTAIV